MRIVVFFSGTGTNLESIIHNQKKYGYEVCACFTNNPKAGGIHICEDHGLECKVIDNNHFTDRVEYDKEIDLYLNSIEPDFIILAGYMRIFSSCLVDNW